jgi:hypothetical protein
MSSPVEPEVICVLAFSLGAAVHSKKFSMSITLSTP